MLLCHCGDVCLSGSWGDICMMIGMVVQAIRLPALPVGCETKSSGAWWIINDRPLMAYCPEKLNCLLCRVR